ncbi:UNVERIFIED_ORG: hypothetical protein J2811_003136 [Burkholderia cepacia]|nr:hypothetical protein [Burkholderia cepacia]MDP9669786.1 hypothetical protein [Burkholderia cepacia]MDP9716718.1 hypothetical protein [Burkholderia cepacia]
MLVFAVEAVETAVERTQRDRVERQARHVIGHVDRRLGAETFPVEEHLIGDVNHLVEHRPDAQRSERLHQHPMRLCPVRFIAECREQPVADCRSQFEQRLVHGFLKPAFVAHLVDECLPADDVVTLSEHLEPVNRPVRSREIHHLGERRGAEDFHQVTDDGLQRRLRDEGGRFHFNHLSQGHVERRSSIY